MLLFHEMQNIGEAVMIINPERSPSLSLYYLGSLVLKILLEKDNILIENLYETLQLKLGLELHIDFFYYALDWLYIISAIKLDEEMVCLCA